MSALDKLGGLLRGSLYKLLRAPTIDEAAIKGLTREFQRALLQADVEIHLLAKLTERIEERALKEPVPPGFSRSDHVAKVVFEELARLLGERSATVPIASGAGTMMVVGLQGSGKTTSVAKIANFLSKKGRKVGLVCADTYRPGAYAQLKQLADSIGVPVYGGRGSALELAVNGVKELRRGGCDTIVIDTAGRHRDEKSLMVEVESMVKRVSPDEVLLVIDGSMGQQAFAQAQAFHKVSPVSSIVVTKLDSSARGGGALSAVAATGAPIKFVGTGEGINDLEPFDPPRFVGRLLGMGDLRGLLERAEEAELAKEARPALSGKFTLDDMYRQLQAVQRMGPIRRFISMIPFIGPDLPEGYAAVAEGKIKKWCYVIQSMTNEERENPALVRGSRVHRIARGAGVSEQDVKELVQHYFVAKKALRMLVKQRRAIGDIASARLAIDRAWSA